MPDPFTTAIVFATDQAYVFLARGLVLSLNTAGFPNAEAKLVMVDLGCNDEARAWMRDHGAEIVPFDPTLIPPKVEAVITPGQRAMAMRPWLPKLIPQHYDHIVWLDCDLWLQNGDVIKHLRAGAQMAPDNIMVAPGNSHYNSTFYGDLTKLVNMHRIWYSACYDDEIVAKGVSTLHVSGGVFGMHRASSFWAEWGEEIEYHYPAVAKRNTNLVHLAEQIALNVVIMRTNKMTRLDPLYNFHVNAGGALRLEDGRVVTNLMIPIREIGVIHLANWKFLRQQYLQLGLLYQRGEYLTQPELRMLYDQIKAAAPAQ
jgi:hypothetical protein